MKKSIKYFFIRIQGDYNSLGIPKVPSNKKSPPARPGPPVRPPLPKSPIHTPKAGVISVIPQAMHNDTSASAPIIPRSLPPPPTQSGANEYSSVQSTPSPHSSPINEPKTIPPSLPPTSSSTTSTTNRDVDASNAIYEEINDDVVSV